MQEPRETPPTCPLCHAELLNPGRDGQCPACLLRAGLAGEALDPDETLSYPLPAGQRIRYLGDYELIEEIGRGGMGVVFRALQTGLDRPVAVKVLMGGTWASEEARRRFKLEAKAAASVKHRSIVAVHEVGEHEGQPYFSMDLIEGEDLGKRLAREVPGRRQAALWMRDIAEAVDVAHRGGVVHRDLKPSNIILDGDHPLVTDFGLARLESPGGPQVSTLTGQLMGTPGFLAPERLAGETGDAAGDIYSLGAMLYALLTGQAPFAGYSISEALRLASEEGPRPPRAQDPSIPADLEAICLRCLEKESSDRYASAEELRRDLERFLDGRPVRARPVNLLARTWRRIKRNRRIVGTAALVALVLGAMTYHQRAVRLEAENERIRIDRERAQEQMWVTLRQHRGDGDRAQAIKDLESLTAFLAEIPESDRTISQTELTAEAMAIWSLPELSSTLIQPGRPLGAAFSDDGERLALLIMTSLAEQGSTRRGVLEIRKASTGELLEKQEVDVEWQEERKRTFHPSGMPSLPYPAGRIGDSTIAVFEPGCGCLRQLEVQAERALLAPYLLWKFGPGGAYAYLTPDFELTLASGGPERTLPMPARPLHFSSASALDIYMGALLSFDLETFDMVELLTQEEYIASSSDQAIALIRRGEEAIVWDTRSRRKLRTLKGETPSPSQVRFSTDGSFLALKRKGKALEIHSSLSRAGEPTVLAESAAYKLAPANAGSFSLDHRLFALPMLGEGEPHLLIWDVLNGELLHRLDGQLDALWGARGELVTYGYLDERYEESIFDGTALNGTALNAAALGGTALGGTSARVSTNFGFTLWRLERGRASFQVTRWKPRRLGDLFRVETTPRALDEVHFVDGGHLAADAESWRLEHADGRPLKWAGRWTLAATGPDGADPDDLGLLRRWAPDGADQIRAMATAALGESVADLTGQISSLEPAEARPALSFYSLARDAMVRVGEPDEDQNATLYPESFAFAEDGAKVFVAGSWMRPLGKGYDFLDFTFDLWDAETGEHIAFLSKEHVTRLAPSPDGRLVAAAGQSAHDDSHRGDDGVAIWNLEGKKILSLPHEIAPTSVTWSGDGQAVITGHADGLLQWTRFGDGMEKLETEQWQSGLGTIRGLAADAGADRLLAVDSQGTLMVWGLGMGAPVEIHRFPLGEVGFESVAIDSALGLVAIGDENGRLHLIELDAFEDFLTEHSALHRDP